jgi:two-component system, NarL family, nitrate/nitrite response regulator NarL
MGGMGATFDVVLADGHTVFLDGLTAVLTDAGYCVCGTASTRTALLEKARTARPGLAIIDSDFTDGDGVGAVAEIAELSPVTKVVVLTADDRPETMRQALSAGAVGYLHKSRGVPAVVEALRRVSAGEVIVEGTFSPHQSPDRQGSRELRLLATYLTPRELECLALLAAGLGTSAIASQLGVSTTTIRSHIQAVLTKLGVHSRLEAASLAIRYGLVDASRGAGQDDG